MSQKKGHHSISSIVDFKKEFAVGYQLYKTFSHGMIIDGADCMLWSVTQNHLGSRHWKLFGKGQVLSKKYLTGDWMNHLSVYHCLSQANIRKVLCSSINEEILSILGSIQL